MKLQTSQSALFRPASPAGFTLVEMMMSVAAGAMLLGALVAMMMFTGKSFYMMGSYVDLDMQSRNAADTVGRAIRNSNKLLNYSTTGTPYLWLTNSTLKSMDYISYYSGNGTLMWTNIQNNGTRTVQMLLTNCDSWSFSLYTRVITPTSNDILSYSTTSASQCKMINMTWHSYRKMLGSKFTTEIVQTAQIVLRNKVN
jgi:prepilin-type N-terminal cleavage/methylation domain-containing protein